MKEIYFNNARSFGPHSVLDICVREELTQYFEYVSESLPRADALLCEQELYKDQKKF